MVLCKVYKFDLLILCKITRNWLDFSVSNCYYKVTKVNTAFDIYKKYGFVSLPGAVNSGLSNLSLAIELLLSSVLKRAALLFVPFWRLNDCDASAAELTGPEPFIYRRRSKV